ncbi:MAG: DMT family transporter [Jatrophihabitantaceae bacterium]
MRSPWLVVLLSLLAAVSFAASSSLKHVSAGHVPDAQSLQLNRLTRFVRATATHPLWLAGIGCDVVGLALQVLALHWGALSVVQPLLISGLLFALVLRQVHDRRSVSAQHVMWAVLLAGAIAGFVVLASNGNGSPLGETADRLPAAVAGAVGAVLTAVCIELGRRQRAAGQAAALLGIAVGVIYAGTAALLKSLTHIAARSLMDVVTSWQLYAVAVLGLAGLLLNQLAFQAGPITASLPATATVDPLLSIVIGVLVYDEHIRRGPGGGIILICLLLLMGATVVQLARSTAESDPASPRSSPRTCARPTPRRQ